MILLDTCTVIDIHRGKKTLQELLERFEPNNFCISAITVEELHVGLGYTSDKMGESVYLRQKKKIDEILADLTILPISIPVLERAGYIKGTAKSRGVILDTPDAIIGATGELGQAEKLITRNPEHFQFFGLSIETA
ncbi:MAG TPA: type II toxin-antitoxin system VapC family toxin [Candidatus Lokiarchaeia archaeon]|nr:type II toxin-antitoxin system VapC family toxin [Candidatus Lokiarchaeia archaeon]